MPAPDPHSQPSPAEDLGRRHGVSLPSTLAFCEQRAAFLRDWVVENSELSPAAKASLTRRVLETDGLWNEPESITDVYEPSDEPGKILICYQIEGEALATPLDIEFKGH